MAISADEGSAEVYVNAGEIDEPAEVEISILDTKVENALGPVYRVELPANARGSTFQVTLRLAGRANERVILPQSLDVQRIVPSASASAAVEGSGNGAVVTERPVALADVATVPVETIDELDGGVSIVLTESAELAIFPRDIQFSPELVEPADEFSIGPATVTVSRKVSLLYPGLSPFTLEFFVKEPLDGRERFTVSDLRPNALMYVYQGSLDVRQEVTTDANGMLQFDVSKASEGEEKFWVMGVRSTLYIYGSGSGCTSPHSWNSTTNTCTLGANVTQTLQVDPAGRPLNIDCDGHYIGYVGVNGVVVVATTPNRLVYGGPVTLTDCSIYADLRGISNGTINTGTYTTVTIALHNTNIDKYLGTSGPAIYLTSSKITNLTIDSGSDIRGPTGSNYVVHTDSVANVVIDDCVVRGKYGMKVNAGKHVSLTDSTIYGIYPGYIPYKGTGLWLGLNPDNWTANTTISRNTFSMFLKAALVSAYAVNTTKRFVFSANNFDDNNYALDIDAQGLVDVYDNSLATLSDPSVDVAAPGTSTTLNGSGRGNYWGHPCSTCSGPGCSNITSFFVAGVDATTRTDAYPYGFRPYQNGSTAPAGIAPGCDVDGDGIWADGNIDGYSSYTDNAHKCPIGVTSSCDDNCPGGYNPGQGDADSDGVVDGCDNCEDESNSSQTDTDSDGFGDVCDDCPDGTYTDLCAGKECGDLGVHDGCGLQNVNCGNCPDGEVCGGGGEPFICGCTYETDAAFCTRLGSCGPTYGLDSCGLSRLVENCGACTGGLSCLGGGNLILASVTYPETPCGPTYCAQIEGGCSYWGYPIDGHPWGDGDACLADPADCIRATHYYGNCSKTIGRGDCVHRSYINTVVGGECTCQ